MNIQKSEKLFQLMKQYGVSHFKNEKIEIRMDERTIPEPSAVTPEPQKTIVPHSQAIPPKEIQIPHHVNEVQALLKLKDEDLVDKLFPDYSNMPPKQAGA